MVTLWELLAKVSGENPEKIERAHEEVMSDIFGDYNKFKEKGVLTYIYEKVKKLNEEEDEGED